MTAKLCIYIWETSGPTPAMIKATLGFPQSLQVNDTIVLQKDWKVPS